MKTLNFSFSTKLTFDDYVHDHSFALRIIPPDTESQKIISCSLNISPSVITKQTVDAFGNNVTAGYIQGDHRFLDFDIKGTAEVDSSKHSTFLMPCYLYQSEFTAPDEKLIKFYSELKGNYSEKPAEKAFLQGGTRARRARTGDRELKQEH